MNYTHTYAHTRKTLKAHTQNYTLIAQREAGNTQEKIKITNYTTSRMPFPTREKPSPRRQNSNGAGGGGGGGSLSSFPLSLFRSATASVVGRSTGSLTRGQTAKEQAEQLEQRAELLKGIDWARLGAALPTRCGLMASEQKCRGSIGHQRI